MPLLSVGKEEWTPPLPPRAALMVRPQRSVVKAMATPQWRAKAVATPRRPLLVARVALMARRRWAGKAVATPRR
jgi:hypothetical protein